MLEVGLFMGTVLLIGVTVLGGTYTAMVFNNRKIKGTITVKAFKGEELVYLKTYTDEAVDLRLVPGDDGKYDRMEIT